MTHQCVVKFSYIKIFQKYGIVSNRQLPPSYAYFLQTTTIIIVQTPNHCVARLLTFSEVCHRLKKIRNHRFKLLSVLKLLVMYLFIIAHSVDPITTGLSLSSQLHNKQIDKLMYKFCVLQI